jgi:ADP-heptose:LPS heptosyltransferase
MVEFYLPMLFGYERSCCIYRDNPPEPYSDEHEPCPDPPDWLSNIHDYEEKQVVSSNQDEKLRMPKGAHMYLNTVSIVGYNNLFRTKLCLESVLKHSPAAQIIFTDNGSSDGTGEYVQSMANSYPQIGIARNQRNCGFIQPQNHALGFALGKFFVVLNNDVEVGPNWLEKMNAEFLKDSKLAVCGASGACCSLDSNCIGSRDGSLEYVEASCLMVRTWLARRYGLFSDYLHFNCGEDSDLSLRMREMGFRIAVVDLPIRHTGLATVSAAKHKMPLDLIHAGNHAVLRRRWSHYLTYRDFHYRFVVRRTDAAGDVLMTTPLLREMRHRFPDSHITVVTDYPEVLQDNPRVDVVSAVSPNSGTIVDLDLSYERSPWQHILDAYSNIAGVEITDRRLELFPQPDNRQRAAELMGDGRWVVIHPGPTQWPGRNWPVERFQEVVHHLKESGWKIALLGGLDAHSLDFDLDARGSSVHDTAAIIERSELFVGIDSFPMHVAQAMLRPLVAVFGAIEPTYRLIGVPFFRGVKGDPKTAPCIGEHHRLPPPQVQSMCDGACMRAVTVEMVLANIPQALEAYKMQQETSKIRDQVLPWISGSVIDIGCFRDKITPDAVGFDDDFCPGVDIVGDASAKMPFEDGHFDTVYSSHCLEDLVDTELVLYEWLRILKPAGHIVLYLPHADLYRGYNQDHKQSFRPDDIKQILRELGCSIIKDWVDVGENRYSFVVIAQKP